jgi:hypothetical protein
MVAVCRGYMDGDKSVQDGASLSTWRGCPAPQLVVILLLR